MLLSIDSLKEYLFKINPSLIILQNITFANSAYASEVLKNFDCPILLWTLREPTIDGGRLRLNSLTGAYSAANAIRQFKSGEFEYIFGSPIEENVIKTINATIKASKLKYDLSKMKMVAVGHTPQGFGFGRAMDMEFLSKFKVTLDSIESRELMDIAKSYELEDCESYLDELRNSSVGLDAIPKANLEGFAR